MPPPCTRLNPGKASPTIKQSHCCQTEAKGVAMIRRVVLIVLGLFVAPAVGAQTPRSAAAWSATVANAYRVAPNITYLTASNYQAMLDVYTPSTPGPHPTILHIHGGGWTGGTKESVVLRVMPYLEMGFAVVNATYRLARVAEAPAAVEDCRCALRW